MLRKSNSRWVTKVLLYSLWAVLWEVIDRSPKWWHPSIWIRLERVCGHAWVQQLCISDCPVGNIWSFDLFQNSFEISFVDRWPHLVWWSGTWLGYRVVWSPRPESTGLGTREESWPLKFSASRRCGERRIRRRDSYELYLMGSLEKAVLMCFVVWIAQGRWHLRFVTWQASTCQMHQAFFCKCSFNSCNKPRMWIQL